jgi:hypothetical protein
MVFVMLAAALVLTKLEPAFGLAVVPVVLLDEVDVTAVTMVYFSESFNAALGLQ